MARKKERRGDERGGTKKGIKREGGYRKIRANGEQGRSL